jgi:hypothetical protein
MKNIIIIRVWRFLKIKIINAFRHNYFKKENNVLVYLGLFHGASFANLIHSHKICYGFEANPEFYKTLKKEV